jgi:outer membrane protein assembly factor BamA
MLVLLLTLLNFHSFSQDFKQEPVRIQRADSVKRAGKNTIRKDTLGRFLTINRIFITGNKLTRDQIIIRELSLKSGDVVYSSDLASILDLDRKKLINTRLFNTVEIRTLELETQKIDLLVDLNERWYTFPSPIFELADRNFNEWWQNYNHDFKRINYGLRLYQFNMRGRNETLRAHAQLGFQRRFELMYRFPYIDKRQKHGLTLDVGFYETKNLAYRTVDHKFEFLQSERILRTSRSAILSYSYRKSFYQIHSFDARIFSLLIDDTVKLTNPLFIKGEKSEQTYSSLSYSFNSDHRDFISYPLKGHQFFFQAIKTGLIANDDVQKIESNVSYSRYFDLKKGFFLSNNTVAYWSTPENLSYTNYGVLGMKRQFVRGYELYVIEGPYYFLNKTTFKKLLLSRKYHWKAMPLEQFRHIPVSIYVKTYADLAYVKNYSDYEQLNINTRLSDKLLSGAGFGFDIIGSYDLVLRFEYSFNAEGERGFFFHVKREF